MRVIEQERQFSGSYEADVNHSSAAVGVRHMGVGSFRARFDEIEARLTVGEDGIRLDGRAAVESISIRQPPEFRAHVVYGADFFDAGNHPHITFASREVELDADGSANVSGTLTIKGITRPITATGTHRAPVEDPYGAKRAALDLVTRIDRRDFALDWQAELPGGGDVLGWDVELELHLEFVQA